MLNFFKRKPEKSLEDYVTKKWKFTETEAEVEEAVFDVKIIINGCATDHQIAVQMPVCHAHEKHLPMTSYTKWYFEDDVLRSENYLHPETQTRWVGESSTILTEPSEPVGTKHVTTVKAADQDWAVNQIDRWLTSRSHIEDESGVVIHCSKIHFHSIVGGPHVRKVKVKTYDLEVVPVGAP